MRRRLILFFLVLVFAFPSCGKEYSERLTIVHTNDLHGHILPERVAGWEIRMGGSAVFASWVKQIRRENNSRHIPTILVDAGDIYMGTPEGSLRKGGAVVELMNRLGYDALVIGNHEFDYGYYNLQQLAGLARFPFLGANVYWKGSGRLVDFLQPFLIKKMGDLKVAFLGVVTEETASITLPRNVDQVIFKKPAEVIKSYLPFLREEDIDLLVVLSHLGLEADAELVREVPEIDLVIGGHSHDLLERPRTVKGSEALIVQAGSYGLNAGKLDLWVDKKENRITKYRYRLFSNREMSLPPDLEIARFLEKVKRELGEEYDQPVGLTLSDIIPSSDTESYLGDLISDAVRQAAGTELAFQNAYGIRAPLLEGTITYREVYKILPFGDTLVTMELTGGQLKELLEQSLTLDKGMLQVSGLKAEYSLKRPRGQRLLKLEINDEEAEDDTWYSVATNAFLAGGGDYFETFTRGRAVRDTGILLRQTFLNYIRRNSPFYRVDFLPRRLIRKD